MRFQYSLRSLLGVMTLACVGLSGWKTYDKLYGTDFNIPNVKVEGSLEKVVSPIDYKRYRGQINFENVSKFPEFGNRGLLVVDYDNNKISVNVFARNKGFASVKRFEDDFSKFSPSCMKVKELLEKAAEYRNSEQFKKDFDNFLNKEMYFFEIKPISNQ